MTLTVSILELVKAGGNLPNASAQVNYPTEGVSLLAAAEENHFWFRSRRKLILSLLRRHLSSSAPIGIDIGCGSGFTDVWLQENGFPTVGVDAYDGFKNSAQLHPHTKFLQGDLLAIEPAPEFDFVLLMDVLEHLEDDAGFMKHATKLLKPGGIIIVTVPAFRSLWSEVDDFAGHLRRYGRNEIRTLKTGVAEKLAIRQSSFFYLSTLPLYFVSRLVSLGKPNGARKFKSESSPPAIVNSVLLGLLNLESLLALRCKLPAGSSWFAVFQKI